MIQVDSLTFHYPHTSPTFQDFSWKVERGEKWTILGPSGCGKSTLLYLLAGLRQPSEGSIQINGQILNRPRPHTGLILQDYGLLPWATIRENVNLGLMVRGFYGPDGTHAPKEHSNKIDAQPWLERLGIAEIADKYPAQVSGGQRQRAAIGRTLTLQPDLLLMDEPFSSLDAVTRDDLHSLVLDLCAEQNITMVMVTHAIEEAVTLGQKILLLAQPPNTRPNIFENQSSAIPEYRQSDAYRILCQSLRQSMEAA